MQVLFPPAGDAVDADGAGDAGGPTADRPTAARPGPDLPALYAADRRPTPADRPWVLINMVSSLDGATAVDGVSGGLGGEGDHAAFRAIRALPDVILVGAGTVRAERYRPPSLPEERQAERVARGQAPLPRLAIVSARLDLDPAAEVFGSGRPLVVTHEAADAGRRRALAEVAEVVDAGTTAVDVTAALRWLRAAGTATVLAEGGPHLNGTLLAAGVVDELCLTLAPVLVGGASSRITAGPAEVPTTFALDRLVEHEGELLGRWVRRTS